MQGMFKGIVDKLNKMIRFFTDSEYRFLLLANKGYYNNRMDDETYLKRKFEILMGEKLDLEDPITFNQKIQWLKLYDRKPVYTTMVDKYEVKKYVREKIGAQYIIPTLEVWNKVEEIDFAKLPEQFVLKCTHDSGGVVVCKSKQSLNINNTKRVLKKSLKRKYFYFGREWPYKNVRPRIIAEAYMEDDETKELRDYKFFTFNGKAQLLFIASERHNNNEETKFDFFDMEFNHLDFTNGHPNANMLPQKPKCFEEMRDLAEKLSEGIPHLRVDFYEVNGRVYFGELTFSHWSGFKPFEPKEWDLKLGNYIVLPKRSRYK